MKITITIDGHVWNALKAALIKERPDLEFVDYEYLSDEIDKYSNEILCNHLQGLANGRS
jgi:hypothetical protein